mmetsp:Transcript_14372/g.38793  ORF Transcript_14372/g.38793 Transcript_14372/m.38793 type:complete len:176 (+) Transcript_14372:174-701(+)
MQFTLLMLVYALGSLIALHMWHDLIMDNEPGVPLCSRTCEEFFDGVETCTDRLIPAERYVCKNYEMTRVGLDWEERCHCPFMPLMECQARNSSSLVFAEISTGECVAVMPKCYWAISAAVAGLIGIHGIIAWLTCGASTKKGGFSIPGMGLVRGILGSGAAGPAGMAASKVLRLF